VVQLGIAFREVEIALRLPQTAADIAQHSPSGKIPVLIMDGLTIWDSLAIFEMLAERHPTLGIWPRDGRARAMARCVCAEMHAGFQSLRQNCPMDFNARGLTPVDGNLIGADVVRMLAIWRDCRRAFGADGPFLFSHFSAADAMFAPVVSRFASYGIDLAAHEDDGVAAAYRDAILALPAMKEWGLAAQHARIGGAG
jgi:glutathione S-transferase